MDDIYTGIDIGTDSIKIVVCEKTNDKYHVLASISSKSVGIEYGFIKDMKAAVSSIKEAVKKVNSILGIKINKVIACVPPVGCQMDIVSGSCDIIDYNEITGKDVSNVLLDALRYERPEDYELVTAMPINFTIDDEESVKDPKGLKGSKLDTRVVVSTTEKEPLYRILEALKLSGLEVIDICYSSFGDYYALSSKKYDNLVGAIINIGEESTNVSVFNRGIQIKNGVVPIGSKSVDKDLTYVFKSKLSESREIKENFAVALSTYADSNDIWTIKIDKTTTKDINQVGVSKVVEARVREILKLAKNEIKNLTNREIRYIIITGGLTELAGFQYLVEQEFGFIAKIGNTNTTGIRHNKYSSCYGIIKFFNNKLELRQKKYSMFDIEEIEKLRSAKTELNGD